MGVDYFQWPIWVQVALGGGYLGYLVAYLGIRAHHKQADIAFLTMAFGLIATLAFGVCEPVIGYVLASIAAVLASVMAGVFWRVLGRRGVRGAMRFGRISFVDDDHSAWETVFADTNHDVSQVRVDMDDGTQLFCEDLSKFANAAIRPVIVGNDGSVAMYVTHVYRRGQNGDEIETPRSDVISRDWGDRMTLIPASRIKALELRFKRRA